jgi:YHS domain-containing protein
MMFALPKGQERKSGGDLAMADIQTPNKAVITTVIDPVCGAEVYPGGVRRIAIYCGRAYWFCSLDCRTAFEMNPQQYLKAKGKTREGWFRRYLKRTAKIGKEKIRTMGYKCH